MGGLQLLCSRSRHSRGSESTPKPRYPFLSFACAMSFKGYFCECKYVAFPNLADNPRDGVRGGFFRLVVELGFISRLDDVRRRQGGGPGQKMKKERKGEG
jgi:hypothetical protein